MVLAELKSRSTTTTTPTPSSWADIDPKELRTDVLQLRTKPQRYQPEEEEDKDTEIPF